jgi:predicted 2-oxoglutarate/Fe(II)-dependent dioxygenase YbiX/peroxiredoxin
MISGQTSARTRGGVHGEMMQTSFRPGDPAPMFCAESSGNPRYHFDTVAGRYVVLCFLGSSIQPRSMEALRGVQAHRELFDDVRLSFFGITVDKSDRSEGRLNQQLPGIRFFWDFDLALSRLYGAVSTDEKGTSGALPYRPFWLVLDPSLRVLAQVPFEPGQSIFDYLKTLPPVELHAGVESFAPVLTVPRVFEPAFCRHLVQIYERCGGEESGFMREVDGKTIGMYDDNHKRRKDCVIEDKETRASARIRIQNRLVPEIEKAFQFRATRMERYIVACYDADTGGYFRPHRDNTTRGTAHRRFAVTLNLNAEEYAGGELRFPEFGPRTYRAPTGGAVVFSCSLLHEATPVTSGRRYAFLPFLYDDPASKIREANRHYILDPTEAPAGEVAPV